MIVSVFFSCSNKKEVKKEKPYTVQVYLGTAFDPIKTDKLFNDFYEKTGIQIKTIEYMPDFEGAFDPNSMNTPDIYLTNVLSGEAIPEINSKYAIMNVDASVYLYDIKRIQKYVDATSKELKKMSLSEFKKLVREIDKKITFHSKESGVFSFPISSNKKGILSPIRTQSTTLTSVFMKKYFDFLNFNTKYIGNEFGKGMRDKDIVKSIYYGEEKQFSVFNQGKTLFGFFNTNKLEKINFEGEMSNFDFSVMPVKQFNKNKIIVNKIYTLRLRNENTDNKKILSAYSYLTANLNKIKSKMELELEYYVKTNRFISTDAKLKLKVKNIKNEFIALLAKRYQSNEYKQAFTQALIEAVTFNDSE